MDTWVKSAARGFAAGSALMILFATQAAAQTAVPIAQTAASPCQPGQSVLKDVYRRSLPESPEMRCSDGATPSSVVVQGKNLRLYAYGTAPYPVTHFGGILRECDKLLPGYTACFTTHLYETLLTESAICGYPATPTYILACDKQICSSEIYSQACGTSSPDLSPDQKYSAPAVSLSIAGMINDGSDFGNQNFASGLDITANLNMAERIVRQGRIPILNLGALLMGYDGGLRASAAQDLSAAMARYPSVFSAPGLAIEVYDEPFFNTDPAALPARISGIKKSISLLRSAIPAAALGVVVAPVWSSDPLMVASFESILPGLDWVATDPYAQSLDAAAFARSLTLAKNFANFMKIAHPSKGRWLVVQGFSPVFSPLPSQWTPQQMSSFKQFLLDMAQMANKDYDGAAIWGWSNAYELPDRYTGKFFPAELKQLYLSKSLGQ